MIKYKNNIECSDTKSIFQSEYINWDYFKNSTVLVTGATGLIGTQIVKALLYANEALNANIKILALVRNKKKADEIFLNLKGNEVKLIVQNIQDEIKYKGKVDFIIHTANTTSSKEMVEKPVETINSIVQGTENVLKFAKKKAVKSIVYLSSMEVYGNIPVDREEALKEDDYGYINILNARSSYPEGKRIAENLCYSYFKEYNVPVKIARLAQTIGAGVNYNDGRVFAEFARCVVEKRDIVLKTKGETVRSYIYITDAVAAILSMLEKGDNGESYNIANEETTCSIKEMAEMLCNKYPNINLVFNIDNKSCSNSTKYYLGTIKYYLDTEKYFQKSGWKANVDLKEAYSRVIGSFLYQKDPFKNEQKSSFWRKIFAIENVGLYKVITILGIQIKLNRANFYKIIYANIPVKKNKIVINNFGGRGYGCNPKYIAEEIIKRKLPYEIVWLCRDENAVMQNGLPKGIKTTGFRNKKAIKDLYSARIVISNVHCNIQIGKGWIKTDKQKYIQTWHGSLGIKKIDYSVKSSNNVFFNEGWHNLTKIDNQKTDFLITNSEFEQKVFREGLKWNKDFCQFGHPRNDIFFWDEDKKRNIKNKVLDLYKINPNKKLALFAPSFRDDKNIDVYNLDCNRLLQCLEKNFGGEWVVLIRLHPQLVGVKYQPKLFDYSNKIINASFYPDVQELLVASDIGITDYSSWIFDFMLSRKPGFIYAEDLEKYNTERGFYYPIESTPFPVAQNNEELFRNIEKFNYDKYKKEVELFLKSKGCMEDGHASERVVDLIEEIMEA